MQKQQTEYRIFFSAGLLSIFWLGFMDRARKLGTEDR